MVIKKVISILSLLFILSSPSPHISRGRQCGIHPFAKTFEGIGYTVSWFAETPEKAFVTIGDYPTTFLQDGSNIITVDEGDCILRANAYLEDGITYIPEDSVALCGNLYLYHTLLSTHQRRRKTNG